MSLKKEIIADALEAAIAAGEELQASALARQLGVSVQSVRNVAADLGLRRGLRRYRLARREAVLVRVAETRSRAAFNAVKSRRDLIERVGEMLRGPQRSPKTRERKADTQPAPTAPRMEDLGEALDGVAGRQLYDQEGHPLGAAGELAPLLGCTAEDLVRRVEAGQEVDGLRFRLKQRREVSNAT